MRSTARSACLLAGIALVSCSDISTNHGHVPSEAELAQIEIGVTKSDTVLQAVGSPMIVDELYEETWIYVDSEFSTRGPRAARLADQRIVAVTFTDDGRVARIDQLTMAEARTVALNANTTEIYEGRLSIFDQLMRAFGRVDPQSIIRQDNFSQRPSRQ